MKSAWELALERTGGALTDISEECKTQLAEIDKRCKAKLAEIDIVYQDKLAKARDTAEIEQLQSDMQVEKASVEDKSIRDKANVRKCKK